MIGAPPAIQRAASFRAPARSRLTIRRLDARDSLAELTDLLHDAFSRLAAMGLNCTCVDQSVAVTRQRVAKGDCYVAECDGVIVGTVTLCGPDPLSPCEHYRRPGVASIRQLGIAPGFQGIGLGSAFMDLAVSWATSRGYRRLALDTPTPARHLLDFYAARGFRVVELLNFPGRRYLSSVMGRRVADTTRAMTQWPSPETCAAAGAGTTRAMPVHQGALVEPYRQAAVP